MDQDDPAFGADEMGALFRTVLDQPEPGLPPALLPQVRRSGGRLRRRRQLLAGGATVAAVSVLATAGWVVSGRPAAQHTPAGPDSPAAATRAVPSTAAPSTAAPVTGLPRPDPADTAATNAYQRQLSAQGNLALLEFLRAHLPEDFSAIADGPKEGRPGVYKATRTDGGLVTVVRRPSWLREVDRTTPNDSCDAHTVAGGRAEPLAADCESRVLPDGSVVMVRHLPQTLQGQVSEVNVITPDNTPYALTFLRVVSQPDETSPTVSLQQLLTLGQTPGFLPAIRDGWQDGPTP
ncbi:hypothetical protein [Kitasatospora sp. NPDC090091]|uniref:hypothetical protein n=1 Tax=Kitasatospora sp. NPDC090091 TaxID=3364081 RepID=UPI0038212EE9